MLLRSRSLYFVWIPSMYFATLYTRTLPRSWSQATCEKIGPHTGISRVPWPAVKGSSPDMIRCIRTIGKVPRLRMAMRVKSNGATLSDFAMGPPPFPSLPWHTVQYAVYKAGPWIESIK